MKFCMNVDIVDIRESMFHVNMDVQKIMDYLRSLFQKKDGHRIIHIGDNEVSDGKGAENAGLDAFLIMNKTEMFENSTYNVLSDKMESILDKISVGLFCNRAFDDPFVLYETKGKRRVDDFRDVSYLFIAPEILYFSCWLIKNIIKNKCDFVIYPSRDAFVLQKICSVIIKNQNIANFPNGKYIYVSRRAVCAATVFEQKDIEIVASYEYKGTIAELFRNRFNIELPEEVVKNDSDKVLELISQYSDLILEKCKEERFNYINYLEKMIL